MFEGGGQDGSVDFARKDAFDDGVGADFGDFEVDVGELGGEVWEKAGQQVGCDGRNDGEAEVADEAFFLGRDEFFEAFGVDENVFGLFDDFDTGLSGLDGVFGAVKNFDAEFVFELLNHHAQSGLGDAAVFGCFGKVAELVDGYDVL